MHASNRMNTVTVARNTSDRAPVQDPIEHEPQPLDPKIDFSWMLLQQLLDDGVNRVDAAQRVLNRPITMTLPERRDRARRPAKILLVEDNPGDVRLIEEAFKDVGVKHTLTVLGDGIEALAFLRREEKFQSAERPDIVLLDLNLPGKDGREVLAEMKSDPALRCLPVVVLTSSKAPRDVATAYSLHANCYVRKPLGFDEFVATVRSIQQFWLSSAELTP